MICFPGEDGVTVDALTSSCQVPCKGTECDVLKFAPVLSKGLTLHFEITQIIYSENALNWRIKKSEVSNPMNLGLGFLDFIHISALELTGGLEQAAERFVHLQRYIKYSDSHPRAYSKDTRECF